MQFLRRSEDKILLDSLTDRQCDYYKPTFGRNTDLAAKLRYYHNFIYNDYLKHMYIIYVCIIVKQNICR